MTEGTPTSSGPSGPSTASSSPSSTTSGAPSSSEAGATPSGGYVFSYADASGIESSPTMEQASATLQSDFARASEPEQVQDESLTDLRAKLAQLEKDQSRPGAQLRYTIGGPGEQSSSQATFKDYAAAIKSTQERIAQLEKDERRRSYMEQHTREDHPDEEEGPVET